MFKRPIVSNKKWAPRPGSAPTGGIATKGVMDHFTRRDIGEMLIGFFAIIGVFSSRTLLPEIITPYIGLTLIISTIIVLFVGIYLMLDNEKLKYDDKNSFTQALYHVTGAFFVSLILTIMASLIWGYDLLEMGISGFLTSETVIALVTCMVWASVINTLKTDKN